MTALINDALSILKHTIPEDEYIYLQCIALHETRT